MNDLTFNTLTIVVLAILLVSTLLGIKNGLIRTVLSLFSMLLATILAWILYPYVSDFLGSIEPLRQTIYDPIHEFFQDNLPELISGALEAAGSSEQLDFIENLPLPQVIKDTLSLNNNPDIYESLGVDSFIPYLATTVTTLIINAISVLLTMLLSLIGLSLLMKVVDLISKLPVINTMNKLGGAIAGLVIGYLIMQMLFLAITTFSGTEWGMDLMAQIHESSILTFLYNSSTMIKMAFSQLATSIQG